MKLSSSSSLSLALLAFHANAPSSVVSAFRHKQKNNPAAAPTNNNNNNNLSALERKHRILTRKERKPSNIIANQRDLKNNGNGNKGNGNGQGGGQQGGNSYVDADTTSTGGGGNSNGKSKGGSNKKDKTDDGASHSAHLDTNDNGITLDSVEYSYDAPIAVKFDLTSDYVADDVLAALDLTTMGDWTIGVFMRMANPQGGDLEAITSAVPTIINNAADDATVEAAELFGEVTSRRLRAPRRVQGNSGNSNGKGKTETGPTAPSSSVGDSLFDDGGTDATEAPPAVETQDLPNLDYTGNAVITDTSWKTLNEKRFGNGFDVYLLDQNGAAIMGPGTFYIIKTEDQIEADAQVEKGKKNELAKNGLMKFNHAKTKHSYDKTTGKGSGKSPAADLGMGSGVGGQAIIASDQGNLAEYTLLTDLESYDVGNTVITVTYDISQGVDANIIARARMLKGKNSNNGNGNKPETTTTTQATSPATSVSSSSSTASTATPDDGTPLFETTTTPTPDAQVDMAAGEASDKDYEDVEIDATDVTLYSLGVFDRMVRSIMCVVCPDHFVLSFTSSTSHLFTTNSIIYPQANPQGGSLAPLFSIPFCATPEDCANKTPEELEAGTFSFSSGDIGRPSGYDLWILNGLGAGVAGPVTFYITTPGSNEL